MSEIYEKLDERVFFCVINAFPSVTVFGSYHLSAQILFDEGSTVCEESHKQRRVPLLNEFTFSGPLLL